MLYPEPFTRTGPPKSGFLPQNRTWYVLKTLVWLWYAFYKPSSNLENQMTVCMGYPAMTPQGRAGKRRWKGVGSPCRENGTHKILLMPASMTAYWKCAFLFPASAWVSTKKQRRKSWSDWNFWADESRDVSKIRRTVKVLLQGNGDAHWIIATVQKTIPPLRNALRPHSMNGAHSQLF